MKRFVYLNQYDGLLCNFKESVMKFNFLRFPKERSINQIVKLR